MICFIYNKYRLCVHRNKTQSRSVCFTDMTISFEEMKNKDEEKSRGHSSNIWFVVIRKDRRSGQSIIYSINMFRNSFYSVLHTHGIGLIQNVSLPPLLQHVRANHWPCSVVQRMVT